MSNYEIYWLTLDRVAKDEQLSRRDRLLLDAAKAQLFLGNLGAASALMDRVDNYPLFKCFLDLKEKY